MLKTYEPYPKKKVLGSIYKVNDRRIPLYVMFVENGIGENEIVALFLVTVESADVLTKFASFFKFHNLHWKKKKSF